MNFIPMTPLNSSERHSQKHWVIVERAVIPNSNQSKLWTDYDAWETSVDVGRCLLQRKSTYRIADELAGSWNGLLGLKWPK